MEKQLAQYIVERRFDEAKALYAQCECEKFQDMLVNSAYEYLDIAYYDFVVFLLKDNEQANLHDLAYLLMALPLCHLENAYFIAYKHAKRAAQLTDYKEVPFLENLLFLHGVPDQVITDEEARKVAHHILKLDAKHKVATQWLKERK